jgi:hypothetical protein
MPYGRNVHRGMVGSETMPAMTAASAVVHGRRRYSSTTRPKSADVICSWGVVSIWVPVRCAVALTASRDDVESRCGGRGDSS